MQPTRSPVPIALAGAVAAACTFVVVAGSDVLAQPRLSGWVRAGFVVATVGGGAYTWWRRPGSGFGPLLAVTGLLFAVTSLNALAAPLAFTLGRVAYAAVMLALVYVCLSFPRGRPGSLRDRRFVAALGAAEALVWAAVLALAAALPPAGPFAACAGTCPENALRLVGGAAGAGRVLGTIANAVTVAAFVAVAGLLLARMRESGQAARRTLAPLFVALIAVLVSLAAYTLAREAFDARPAVLSVAVAATILLVPAAILAGQVRGRLFAARRLGSLVADAPVDVERLIGDALGDPTVTLARWEGDGYRDLDGHPVVARRSHGEVELTRDGRPYALVRHAATLDQPPDVVRGLAAAGLMVLDNARLAGELRALIEELGDDAAAATSALRTLARGVYPPLLRERGLAHALQAFALTAPVPVQVTERGDLQAAPAATAAVYFTVLEAVQNAIKHGGPGVSVAVTLERRADAVAFAVADDGPGFDRRAIEAGVGLLSMEDRAGAAGGELEIRSAAGQGTTVQGWVPAV